MVVSAVQALSWRLERQFLVVGAPTVRDVVGRLCGIPAWSGDADLAVRRRLGRPGLDALAGALDAGDVIKTYAWRGATHLMTAADAGVYLSVRAASRQWERASWQTHYDLRPQDWPALLGVVRDALGGGPVTRAELVDAVTAVRRFRHLRAGLTDRSDTLLKPLAWQGELCFGPARDGTATYRSPAASPQWQGIPDLAVAGPRAVRAYLDAYGPATLDNLRYWLVAGLGAGRKRLDGWLAELGDDVVRLEVDGDTMLQLSEHADALAARGADGAHGAVTMLPGHDQWVLGAGTADRRIVPPARRSAVTHGANLVLHDGVVAGTWTARSGVVTVEWFAEAGPVPDQAVTQEAGRLAALLGGDTAAPSVDVVRR